MQQATNTELAAHLRGEQGDRRPVFTVEIDWQSDGTWVDITPIVRSVDVDRSRAGDLPEEAGGIDGYTTAEAKAQLEGTIVDAAGVEWSAAAALSPVIPGNLRDGKRIVRARMRVRMGMILDSGPVLLDQYIGPLRIIEGAEGDGSVEITSVDPSERLKARITLPTYGEFVTHAARRSWALTVNTQGVLDFALRCCGIFASPPPRDEAIISCTGHGALFSERGFNGAPISIYGVGPLPGLWVEDSHPYGMLGTPENASMGTVGYQELYGTTDGANPPVMFQSGYGVGMSCLLHIGNYMNVSGPSGETPANFENRQFQIRPTENDYPRLFVSVFGDGSFYAGLTTGAGQVYATPKIATGAGRWRFVGWHFQWTSDTTLVVRVRVDGALRTYTLTVPKVTITPTPFYDGYRATLLVRAQLCRSWTNLQVWPSYAPPAASSAVAWQGEQHVSMADLDRGLNELVYLPDVSNAEAWDLIKALVAAELGVHGHAEGGRYSFRRRTDVRPSTVDLELDVRTNLVDAKWSTSTDSVRNVVSLTTSKKYHSGKLQTVVKADDALQFICGVGTTVFELDWPFGAAGWNGGVLPYHYQEGADTAARDAGNGFPKWGSDVVHGWTYSSKGASGNWTILDNSRNVVVRYVQITARRVKVRVSNPGPGPIRLATAQPADGSSTGDPALRIGGWPLEDAIDHVESVSAPSRYSLDLGERALALESSEWRQSPDALRPLLSALLDALDDEVTTIEDLEIVGDPRVQTGDVARLRFQDGSTPIVGTVLATHPEAGDDGLVGTVSVRPLPTISLAPAGWSFYIDISRYQGNVSSPIDLARVKALGYRGCVVCIGLGGNTGAGTQLTAMIDPWWERFRDTARSLWPTTFAGYWYVGGTEAPADQAARCAAAIGDLSIPVMLDWESGSGTWSNLLAVLAAFRDVGLRVTMLYTRASFATATANGPASNIDATGLALVASRYWLDSKQYPAQDPTAVFLDIQATRPSFGFETFAGGTVDALQFTDAGVVYSGMAIDVNAFPGDEVALARMFRGE